MILLATDKSRDPFVSRTSFVFVSYIVLFEFGAVFTSAAAHPSRIPLIIIHRASYTSGLHVSVECAAPWVDYSTLTNMSPNPDGAIPDAIDRMTEAGSLVCDVPWGTLSTIDLRPRP